MRSIDIEPRDSDPSVFKREASGRVYFAFASGMLAFESDCYVQDLMAVYVYRQFYVFGALC